MNQRKWTKEEDEYIKTNFSIQTLSEMAKHIGCAITTVQNRAIFLGLEVEKKTVQRWTKEEIELLKVMAPKYLNKTIARKLNRSIGEVNKKARKLGIELIFKRPVWKKWKVKFLKENINVLSLSQIQNELEVSYYQIIDKLDELGIEYKNNFWSEEEVRILIELSDKVYIKEIAKVLNRTEGAIITKANKMGLDYITLKKVYTEEELQYIKDNWKIVAVTDMARKLGVSRAMIQIQADKMNLPKLGNNPHKKWTSEQIDKLRKLSKTKTITELAKHFKTTNIAIQSVASKHSIKLIDEKVHWTEEDNILLTEYAKTMTISEIATKMDKSSSAIRLQAKRLKIKIEKDKSIWTEENNKQLIALAPHHTLLEIVKIMNKTDTTLLKKAKELGIEIKKDEGKEWTQEDIQKLIALSKTKKIDELVCELGRTSSSIKAKAKSLSITIITNRKNWTEEEYKKLEYLLLEKKKSPKEIAEILGRTEDAIMIKINRKGLKLPIDGKNIWTEEEETLLSDLWGSEPIEKIANKLHRTVSAIRNKAYQLRLGSQIESNYEGLKISEISELFNVSVHTISIGWASLGLKVKVRNITQSTSYQYVEIKDLFTFLEKNQNIWDSRILEKNILGKEPEWLKEKRKRDTKEHPEIKKLNLTKQQLILARKFFLELQEVSIDEEISSIDEKGRQYSLQRGSKK